MNERRHLLGVVVLLTALIVVAVAVGTTLALRAQSPAQEPQKKPAAETPEGVAKIGEYVITRAELEDRLIRALRPHEEEYASPAEPVVVATILREMLGEKAMSMEGRQLGYLQDETVRPSVEQYEQQLLMRMVLDQQFRDRVTADPAEVDRAMKENPKWSREQATAMVQQATATRLFEACYRELVQKFHLKTVESNFAQAAQVHQRLLLRPVEKRSQGEYWIKNSQVKNELSEQEKNLPLATYDGGTYTLRDWFQTICNIAPPRRPEDLGTPAGVGKLLERALRSPMLIAEAKARGCDKDPKLRSDVRQFEDQQLLYKYQQEKTKALKDPSADEVKAYFEKNKERFSQAALVKINQIWCGNLEAATKVKAALDGGMDFETAKKTHSLQKDEVPHVVTAVGEGLFWADLWKADPNQVVGPVKGFYGSGVKWRIVKVLEKTPAKPQAYSEQIANSLKWILLDEQRRHVLAEAQAELLKKYPHEIFADKIKDMDPVQIALTREDK